MYEYDLEIIMPVCSKPPYIERFYNFCEYGLINHKNYRILINFLIGTEDIDNFKYEFSENIDVNYHNCEFDHPASKIYEFYCQYSDFYRSKWLVKIDDDSITNVHLILNYLCKLDHTTHHYFTAERVFGETSLTLTLLKEFELLDELKKTMVDLKHEVEISIFSNSVLEKVLKNYREMIEKRSKIQDGYTDQLFFYLVNLSEIETKVLPFLSCENRIQEFLNDELYHIHFIYTSPRCKKMIL